MTNTPALVMQYHSHLLVSENVTENSLVCDFYHIVILMYVEDDKYACISDAVSQPPLGK